MSNFISKIDSSTTYRAVLTIECYGTGESQLKIFLKRSPEDYAQAIANDEFAHIPACFMLMNKVMEFIFQEVNGESIGNHRMFGTLN